MRDKERERRAEKKREGAEEEKGPEKQRGRLPPPAHTLLIITRSISTITSPADRLIIINVIFPLTKEPGPVESQQEPRDNFLCCLTPNQDEVEVTSKSECVH